MKCSESFKIVLLTALRSTYCFFSASVGRRRRRRRTDDGRTTDERTDDGPTTDEKNSDEKIRTKKFGRKSMGGKARYGVQGKVWGARQGMGGKARYGVQGKVWGARQGMGCKARYGGRQGTVGRRQKRQYVQKAVSITKGHYLEDGKRLQIHYQTSTVSGKNKWEIVYAPSNVRLPLELRSDRRETSATRASDDLQISIF